MCRREYLASTIAVALFSTPSHGLGEERTHDITQEDYFTLATLSGMEVAPDGKAIYYEEMRWDEALDGRNTDIWMVSVKGGAPSRLTFDDAADTHPQPSPDGAWVYFLSGRKRAGETKPPYDGKRQVWRISARGGTAEVMTRHASGVEAFQLSADGSALWYSASDESPPDDSFASLRKAHPGVEYERLNGASRSSVFRLDLHTWRVRKEVALDRVIREFAVSFDGKRIAMLTTPDALLVSNEGQSRLDIWEVDEATAWSVDDAKWRRQAPSPFGWLLGLAWAPDGSALATRVDFDGYPGETFVIVFGNSPPRAPAVHPLPRPREVHPADAILAWSPDSRTLCYAADDRAYVRGICVPDITRAGVGKPFDLTPGDVEVTALGFLPDGDRVAAITGGRTSPPDVVLFDARGKGKAERITNVNAHVDTWRLPQIQTVEWKSTDGTTVEGILELPSEWRPEDGPLPLVVEIHGGPTAAAHVPLQYWIYGRTRMPARGWALLSANYRGSTGYGDKFMTDLIGHENERDVEDILTGVDEVVRRGIADPHRMVVMGWSNGGYLTNAVVAKSNRFRAASSGAGIFDIAMQWATQDTPGHNINFMGGLPWQRPDAYRAASPLYSAGNIRTPMLIHVGTADERTPPVHSHALFRALSRYLDVPAELVLYPGAGHGLQTYAHRKAKLAWDIAWFDHWVSEPPGKATKSSTHQESGNAEHQGSVSK